MSKRIVFLDRATLPERFRIEPPKLDHHWLEYPATTAKQTIKRIKAADVVITNKVKITREILAASPRVKHIAVAATGYNIIDIDACKEFGVSVSNIPAYAATTVAEHVMTSALCLRRSLLSYRQNVIANEWQNSPSFCLFAAPINDLQNSVFGVIGLGELGKTTAQKAVALGMNVIYTSRTEKNCDFATRVSFDDLIRQSDVISLHCSLTPQTQNLIADAQFNMMKPGAILINTARGGIVDEDSAVRAIENKRIGGIAFDVLIEEPPKDDSPLLALSKRDNVIITPHTAWASEQAIQSLANILSDNVNAFLLGSAQNLVN